MIGLIFLVVKSADDVLLVPIVYSIGYFIGGVVSIYLIVFRLGVRLVKPDKMSMIRYLKDSSSIFAISTLFSSPTIIALPDANTVP